MSVTLKNRPASEGLKSRAQRLAQLELDYRFHESFQRRGAEAEILRDPPASPADGGKSWQPPREMPAHLARMCERKLLSPIEEVQRFRRMNYAKYRADVLRRKLDPQRPLRAEVERIERLLSQSLEDRNQIVTANIRLVVSIAKKFAGGGKTFDELLSEGIETMMRAVDKFDYARGFRFSTYATTALRHALLRSLQTALRDRERLLYGDPAFLSSVPEPQGADEVPDEQRRARQRRVLARLIRQLDVRERHILARRFGLDAQGACQTLQSLAGELGVCKERVRQLEIRARDKIRALAKHVDLGIGDET
jgi:RNA polymerase primary sigma factor